MIIVEGRLSKEWTLERDAGRSTFVDAQDKEAKKNLPLDTIQPKLKRPKIRFKIAKICAY